jgi:prepilin-type N-terminal cleavage/methylation domain-containing protein
MAPPRKSPTGNRPAQGYTLTELLVVLAIMGLMAALAPPVLQSARASVLARAAAYGLAARLDAAHDAAVDGQSTVDVPVGDQTAVFFPDGSAAALTLTQAQFSITVAPLSGRVIVQKRGGG